MRLGIDFGTTRTVVAAVQDGRYPLAAFDEGGEFREHVPGIAALRDGELVVGWEAARALADGSAEHAIRSLKRVVSALAPDEEVAELPGITALELATEFLRGLRRSLVTHSNLEIPADAPLEAMVAVPANSASRQRWLTLEAFRRAGFAPIGLLNEPTAAAVELAHLHLADLAQKKKSPKRYVVVYDLGGGTFDTSAISLEGRSFELIASEGLARLGGDDFDELVLAAAGVAPSAHALERAREAKETLRPTSRKLLLDVGDREPISIDVADLYARAQPLIDRTLVQTELLFERLRERGIDPDDPRELGGVYLVGGAAAFPAVGRALRARFGKKLQLAPQPFAATAIGLAIAADPDAHVMIHEAITRHFGVWREAAGGVDKVFDPLIGKDTAGPVTIKRRYRPTHAIGHLRFLECGALDRAGQPVQDLVPWADVYFPYDPSLADRSELASVPNERRPDLLANEIAETYTYGTDGTISVRIENVSRGYARTYALGALR
ncbi:MAG: Hsp70 family protein [Deltaproteobacteria bacterium]|nr:Hsp70 family protein [Deltaproteobacteria bacterium]MDQ3297739.1 Hsp70 family protein [Myxococcota bacterium]